MEKPWILDVPILKALSLSLLIINCVALPLVFCFIFYPSFFATTEFWKLVLTTTSFGAIYICGVFMMLVFKELFFGQHSVYDPKFYEVVLLEILIVQLILDFVLVFTYFLNYKIVEIHTYISYTLVGVGAVVFTKWLRKIGQKKETEELPSTSE